ncbi:ppk25, partial [Symbiodinium sp. CCMP2456]
MLQGTYPRRDFVESSGARSQLLGNCKPGEPMYGGRIFKLSALRGDWKHHVNTFKLKQYYNSNNTCHCCRASRVDRACLYTDFSANAAWKRTIRTHREFLNESIGEPLNALILTAGFHYSMLRFDSMHSVNLGCGLFTNGGALFELFKIGWFPGDSDAAQWRAADQNFRCFLQKHKIACSQPAFKSWMLVLRGEEYCYFATKAYNSRVITSWLAEEANKAALQHPGNRRISLTAICVWHLHSWYSQLEQYGRYLSQA